MKAIYISPIQTLQLTRVLTCQRLTLDSKPCRTTCGTLTQDTN